MKKPSPIRTPGGKDNMFLGKLKKLVKKLPTNVSSLPNLSLFSPVRVLNCDILSFFTISIISLKLSKRTKPNTKKVIEIVATFLKLLLAITALLISALEAR